MKKEELKKLLISKGLTHETDSEYNRDVYTENNCMVCDKPTKLEVYVDYYSTKIVWWYHPNRKISKCFYNKDLTSETAFDNIVEFIADNDELVNNCTKTA